LIFINILIKALIVISIIKGLLILINIYNISLLKTAFKLKIKIIAKKELSPLAYAEAISSKNVLLILSFFPFFFLKIPLIRLTRISLLFIYIKKIKSSIFKIILIRINNLIKFNQINVN